MGRRQKALAVSMIGGPIRGKALRGVNEGGVGGRWMCVDRISSVVHQGVSRDGRLIGRGACNQEQEGNKDTRVRQVQTVSTT